MRQLPGVRRHARSSQTLEGARTTAAVVLFVTGVLLLAEAIVTVAWQEPFSALSAQRQQNKLSAELRVAESAALAAPAQFATRRDPVESTPAVFAARERRRTGNGDPLGRLRIPSLGVNLVFVEGANPAQLEKGPGHYAGTALPGERGTVGVAGHRTTYLAPFRHIDCAPQGRLDPRPDALWALPLRGRGLDRRAAPQHAGRCARSSTTVSC